MSKQLRYYQADAIKAAIREIKDRGKRTIISLPTGAGKTITIIELIKQHYDLHYQRVMFLVDRIDLVNQGYANFIETWPELEFDYQNGIGKVQGTNDNVSARLIIATPQTLSGKEAVDKRLEEVLRYGKIDLLVIDEAHTSINEIYMNLYLHLKAINPKLELIGLTATPIRHDGRALSQLYDSIAYHYPLRKAISEGYLCELVAEQVETKIALPEGRMTVEERAKMLKVDNWVDCLLEYHKTLPDWRRGIYYLPSLEHSEKFAEALRREGYKAEHVDYKTSDKQRSKLLSKDGLFMSGEVDWLCNYMLLRTGIDLPPVNFIGLATATTNKVATTQAVGRGTRLYSGKTNCLVVDFTLEGIDLITAGSLLGIQDYKSGEKAVEDEEENLIEGVDLRDLIPKNHFINGSGVIKSKFDLFKKKREAWFSDSEGDIDTTVAQGVWAGDKHDISFAILNPNYKIATRLQEGLEIGSIAKANNPENQEVQDFYSTLHSAYDIFSNYTLWEYCDNNIFGPKFYGENYDELLDRSIEYLNEFTSPLVAHKAKSWRRNPATEKQISLLTRLGYDGTLDEIRKGECNQLINHYILAPKLRKYVGGVLKRCGKYGNA